MLEKYFEVSIDDDNVEILDYIHSQFPFWNWYKRFEVKVTIKEIDYTEDGRRFYVGE